MTTSMASFASALNICGPSADFTLKLSYVPLASRVGVTPDAGDAIVDAASAVMRAAAASAAAAKDLMGSMGGLLSGFHHSERLQAGPVGDEGGLAAGRRLKG